MATPLRYRRAGETRWIRGRTVNVSRSGVLFVTDGPVVPRSTPVEFVIELPNPGVHGGSRVRCRGSVVRCREGPPAPASMAATIDLYEIVGHGAAEDEAVE